MGTEALFEEAFDHRPLRTLILATFCAAALHAGIGLATARLTVGAEPAPAPAGTWVEVATLPVQETPKPEAPEPAPVEKKLARKSAAPLAAPAVPVAAPVAAPASEPRPDAVALAAATEEVVDFGDAVLGAPTPAVTSSSTHRAAGGTGDGSSPDVFDGGRPPGLAGGDRWDCPYPQEAARAHVDNAVVTLEVRIDVDGGIAHLSVRRDPGYGFGREALRCARAKRWTPGLGKDGRPIVGTALVNVRFERS